MFRVFSQYVSRKALLFVLADLLLMSLATVAAYYLRYFPEPDAIDFYMTMPDVLYRVLTIAACFLLCAYYNELYQEHANQTLADYFFRLAQAFGAGCFILASLYFAFPALRVGRSVLIIAIVLMLALLVAFRWAADIAWHTAMPKQNVLILGADQLAADLAREIDFRRDLNMRVVGFLGPDDLPDDGSVFQRQMLGRLRDIEPIVRTYKVERVIVAMDDQRDTLPLRLLLSLRTRGVHIEDAHHAMSALTGRIPLETVHSSWFLFSEGFRRTTYTMAFKRAIDLGLSFVGVILSAPIMAATAVVVRLDSPGPALYRQRRVGYNGDCFDVLKFRTMREDAEADGVARWAEEDDPRVTRVGRFLRKYRFDELPQFLNVIRGEMSFVGPRPERPHFVEKLEAKVPYYDERHTMRPGITGWAQVCYPYGATTEDSLRKLEYDLFYLKNVSILFDVAIVFQTVKIILWGRGR